MIQFLPTVIYLLSFFTSLVFGDMNRILVWMMFITSLIAVIDKVGKGIALRESIIVLYILTCLVMPILGYDVYNNTFPIARILKYTMKVSESLYFGYAIPAISAFAFAISFPLQSSEISDTSPQINNLLERIRANLDGERYLGVVILFVGLISFSFNRLLPVFFQYVSIIFFFTCFAGLLYIYYTPNRSSKTMVLLSFLTFIFLYSISVGMFTIMVYMGITIISFFLIGRLKSFWRKINLIIIFLFLIVILQSTKNTFRDIVFEIGTDNKVALFADLFIENVKNSKDLLKPKALWYMYLRTNQGLIISSVMNRFPAQKSHDKGDMLMKSIMASFIPRFIWPDKPLADGRANMLYFAGKVLNDKTSMNVGPVGEAYGSFGKMGGITFMLLLGVFIRWMYGRIFALAKKVPLLILWIPVIFYQITYSAETDTFQVMNSVIKISLTMAFIYMIIPWWFGKRKMKISRSVQMVTPSV